MQNVSVGKIIAVVAAILFGVAAGLLAGFGLLPLAGGFFVEFIAVFAALSVAAIVLLFMRFSCTRSCSSAYRLLCRDRVFLSVSAAGAAITALFAGALSPTGTLSLLFAILFGLAVFFFVLLLLGWLVYASGFCRRTCTCTCDNCSCDYESVPVRE